MTSLAVIVLLASPIIVRGVSLESRRSEISNLIESADLEERKLPPLIHDLLLFSLKGHTAPYAARLLIEKFDPEAAHETGETWNIAYASWSAFVFLNFSEEERLTIIAHCTPTGGGRHGLSDTARFLFDRPLSELSLAEAGTLIVLTISRPRHDDPDRLNAARDQFLSRYQEESVRAK